MKMLLIRLVQLIENRTDKSRHGTIFLDELKFMNCSFFMNSISTLRDKNANYIIAHQSLVDLKQSDSHLSEDTCARTIVDNCTIRWIYQCQDFETATWVSTLCGLQSTFQPSTYSKSNPLFAEIQNLDKQSTLIEEPVIHSNYVQYMPDYWAVCVGSSSTYASLAYIAYIPVEIVENARIAYPRYEMEELL
jgi:type IV secretory pathway TraG/TraD family ATPase VirD4